MNQPIDPRSESVNSFVGGVLINPTSTLANRRSAFDVLQHHFSGVSFSSHWIYPGEQSRTLIVRIIDSEVLDLLCPFDEFSRLLSGLTISNRCAA